MNLNLSRPCCLRQATPEVPEFTGTSRSHRFSRGFVN